MRDVAIVSFAQLPSRRREVELDDVQMVQQVVARAVEESGIERDRIGFTCSGSSDYLQGIPFSFVTTLDAVGAWPPISESHVEMDGAWALYEAWVRLQHGDVDAALVYAAGKSSAGDLQDVLTIQLDPYFTAPLWPDAISLAALQARSLLDTGRYTERDFAEVAARSRRDALQNSNAQVRVDRDPDDLMREPYLVAPLRRHDCPPISDGAAAVVLAADELARSACERPAWIRGIDHRIEAQDLGARSLSTSSSTRLAAEGAGALGSEVDVAELHAPFAHQELILRESMELGEDVRVNPSGGALAAHPLMVAGLLRCGEAAGAIHAGRADRAIAHATSGPCLQQNLVALLEAR